MRLKISSETIRILILGTVFLFFYTTITLRLWDEQIRQGEEHRRKISRQSIRQIRHPSIRGRIYTSDEHLLADNIPSHDLVFHLEEMRQPGKRKKTVDFIIESTNSVANSINRKADLTAEDIIHHMNIRPGLPMTLFRRLDTKELARAVELLPFIPGLEVVTIPFRHYPEGDSTCHVLGYVGREDYKAASDRENYFYYIPDQVGRDGVEKIYDTEFEEDDLRLRGLRGEPGNSMIRVDFLGFVHEIIGDSQVATSGSDMVLTINWKAQKIAENLLKGKTGAIVVMDANNGAVITMASSPAYNLLDFVPQISRNAWNKYNSDKKLPMMNRALRSYPPGSIIKPLIALAFLNNKTDPKSQVICDGATRIGKARIRCWIWSRGGRHGPVDLVKAIEQSCNDYFIENGRKLGIEKITEMLASAGIGQKTGIPLPEHRGLLPTRSDKMRIFGTKWNSYDTSLLSIGQGLILVSPLRAAIYTAAIANGGIIWKPYLLKELRNPQGLTVFVNSPKTVGKLKASHKQLDIIRQGMWQVVNASTGTAKKARNSVIEISGKTGTAEMGSRSQRYNNTWFIGFGTYEGKTYSICVFIENGKSGGRTSAPIAGKFFNEWLSSSSQEK